MKLLALVGAGALMLLGTTLSSAARGTAPLRSAPMAASLQRVSAGLPGAGALATHRFTGPLQATGSGGTATPVTSPTEAQTATPEPTATVACPGCPDATTLFDAARQKLLLVRSVKFTNTWNGSIPGTETLRVVNKGEATCSGPAAYGHVSIVDAVTGTAQKVSIKASYIYIKNKVYEKTKRTKNTWLLIKKPGKVNELQFAAGPNDVLACSTSGGSGSGSGSGSGTPQCIEKDLHTVGPGTVNGQPTWNLAETLVCVDSTGTEQDAAISVDVTQKDNLLVAYEVSQALPQGGTLDLRQVFSKFGEKFSIKKPKVGGTKPK